MKEAIPEKTFNYLTDSPLQRIDQDLLGWSRLTAQIAAAIRLNAGESGFAVGIKGKWGSGKSTVLNFIENEIREDFIVFRYNPWLYPNENHVQNFFSELAKIIRRTTGSDRFASKSSLRSLALKVERYGAFSGIAKSTARTVAKVLMLITVLLGGTALVQPFGELNIIVFKIAVILMIITAFAGAIDEITDSLARLFRIKSEMEDYTLYEMKSKIGDGLTKIDAHVLVIIDDLDRLPPKEICNVFQIVKNNGDIENLTYLLAFDDEIVKEVLGKEYIEEYRSFTEKIIQISFTLPPPDSVTLGDYFKTELDKVLASCPPDSLDRYWSPERWTNYYYEFVQHTLGSFRDAKRIVNAVGLNMPLIFNEGTIEVDPVDFIIIEIIRMKFPQIYHFIRDNKEIFVHVTKLTDILGILEQDETMFLKRFDKALSSIDSEKEASKLRNILSDLFPRLRGLADSHAGDYLDTSECNVGLRICVEAVFDRYFLYGNYMGDVSNREISDILTNIGRRDFVDSVGTKYSSKKELVKVLERMKLEAPRFADVSGTRELITFLFDVSDHLPQNEKRPAEIRMEFVVTDFVREVLRDAEKEYRINVLGNALDASTGIFGPIAVFAILGSESEKSDEKKEFISQGSLKQLIFATKQRGLEWLRSANSLNHPHFEFMAWVLKKWTADDSFKLNINHLIKEEKNFKKFVTRFLIRSEMITYGKVAGPIEYRYNFAELDSILDVREITQRIMQTRIDRDKDSKEIVIALEKFKDGVDNYLTGKEKS